MVLRAVDDTANLTYVTRLPPYTVALPPPWAAVRCTRQGDQFIPLVHEARGTIGTSDFLASTARATHAHPLHPAALASVPYGIVLVRVRVLVNRRIT